MIRLLTVMMLSLPGTTWAQSLDLPVHEQATSPNGHSFWFVHLDQAETVAINAPFPSDWGHRSFDSVAASLIGTDMMFVGGSGTLDGRQLANALQDVSAFPTLDASATAVTLRVTLNPNFLGEGADLTNQLIHRPQFDPRWLNREVRQAKIDAAEPRVEAGSKAIDAYSHAVYPGLPLGSLTRDDDPTLYDLVTSDLLVDWHRAAFHTGHVIPAIAGPIDVDTAGDLIDRIFTGLPADGPDMLEQAPQADFSARTFFLVDPEVSNGYAQFWGEVQAADDLSGDAASTLAGMLFAGGSLEAPLFQALRTELRATYGFSSFFDETAGGQGMTMFRGDIAPEVLSRVPDIAVTAYAAYVSDGADPTQVTGLTQRIGASIAARFQNARSIASLVADVAQNQTGTLTQALSSYALFATRTPDDIANVLRDAFPAPANLSYIMVGPTVPEGFEGCIIKDAADVLMCE